MNLKAKKFRVKKLLAFLMALVMALSCFPLYAFATDESGAGKQSGTSEGNPFTPGQPSDQYRIPNLVTLDNGNLVAQADARWNGGMDGGGNDSMIAVSDDNGATWDWQLVTYYPDNGDTFNRSSTSVCDSALATDGKNVYSLSTFFPAGYAINGDSANARPVSDNAFNSQGRLLLQRSGESGYNYYLGDFNDSGRAYIYTSSGSQVEGFEVDGEYYLYENGRKNGTLFYSDCTFQTVKTTFLVFRSSSDGGYTWSDMKLLNVKNAGEHFYGVGPGRGIVTSNNTIIFGCYKWNYDSILGIDTSESTQRSSFIYSTDGGTTWQRTDDAPGLVGWAPYGDWNSECQPVELDNGNIRLFMRTDRPRVNYADAVWNGREYVWTMSESVSLDLDVYGEDFTITENNQYSVIPYSKQVQYNGELYDMMIVSHANGGGSSRTTGTLTFLLMDNDNNFVHASQTQITTGFFGYSCLTELPNGQIALLYENAAAAIQYLPIDDIEVTSSYIIPDLQHTYYVNLIKNDQQTYTVSASEEQTTNSDPSVVSTSFERNYSSTASTTTDGNFSNEADLMLTDALYTFTQTPEGQWYVSSQGVHLTIGTDGQPSSKDREAITILNPETGYFQFVDAANEALYMYRSGSSIYTYDQTTAYDAVLGENENGAPDADREGTLFRLFRPARINEGSADDPVPGYVEVTEIVDGGQYLIGCDIGSEFYFLYPSYQPDNIYTHVVKANGDYVEAGWDMTVTALAGGTATVVSGLDTYVFEVSDYSREITGVVDYDPVIYTHGGTVDQQSEIVSYGSTISDGSVEGEKITEYTVRDGYTIIEIGAVDSYGDNEQNLGGTDITANMDTATTGHLSGNLPLADDEGYNSFEEGTYVTLKTTLREESTGLVWTQTDRLYVASNPVPSQVMIATRSSDSGYVFPSIRYYNLPLATYVLAEGSYGNTSLLYGFGDTGCYVGNVQHIYPEDGIMYFNGNNGRDSALTSVFDYRDNYNEFKGAGILSFYYDENNKGSKENIALPTSLINDYTLAYYYYDKSSDKNEGIIPGADADSFSIQFSRIPVGTEYGEDDHWDRYIDIPTDENSCRQYVRQLSGDGTIQSQEYMFNARGSRFQIATDDAGLLQQERTTTVNCTTNVQPNLPTSMRGELRYVEDAYGSVHAYNQVGLTFEIRMCDKSEERTPYENATDTVEKSTWYTTSTWANYMNALLIRQEYLNNYTLLTTSASRDTTTDNDTDTYEDYIDYNGQDTIDVAYQYLQKRADFSELEYALEDNLDEYQQGIVLEDGTNYTPASYEAFIKAYEAGQAFMADERYDTEDERNNVAGYVRTPTDDESYIMGPEVDTADDSKRLEVQITIDNLADAILSAELQLAAVDEVYVAAKAEADKIDMTAFNDNGAEINSAIETGDENIYAAYPSGSENYYVNLPRTTEGQAELDSYTGTVLTNMNTALTGSDYGTSPQLKKFHVDYTLEVDGVPQAAQTVENQEDYYYGTTAHINLSAYASDEYTVIFTVNSESGDKTPTTYNVSELGYQIPILIQEDITVTAEVFTNEILTVVDYYGTVIGTAYINPVDGSQVDITSEDPLAGDSRAISVDGVQIAVVKDNPKYSFTGWTIDGTNTALESSQKITEETVIRQRGTLNNNNNVKDFKVLDGTGTVNGRESFSTPYFNEKLTLEAEEGSVWTRIVGGNVYLASYDSSFVNFSSNEDVNYRAYSQSQLGSLPPDIAQQVADDVPAVYGTGYFANDKFTLSCDYSANDNVNVVEAGVIATNVSTASHDTLVKDGENAFIFRANRIAHWNDKQNSGTFTISITDSDVGTYYMRAYVSYTKEVTLPDGTTVTAPYVAYCDRVFRCDGGHVTEVFQ